MSRVFQNQGWLSKNRSKGDRRSGQAFLACELLEDRRLLAVTNLMDSGPGSLRAEIAATAAGGTVTFMAGLAGTITLSTGHLVVNKALTIDGTGATITVSGNNVSRIFLIDDANDTNFSDVTIRNLTATNGLATFEPAVPPSPARADGGGILSFENLTLDGVTVSNSKNIAGNIEDDGGGISHGNEDRPGGNLTLRNCIFENNRSYDDSGAIDFYNSKNLTITGTRVRGNYSANVGALRVIHAAAGNPMAPSHVMISDSFFENNRSVSSATGQTASLGTALLISTGSDGVDGFTAQVINTVFSGNTDEPVAGQTHLGYSVIDFDSISDVMIRDSTITGNFGTISGGMYLGSRYHDNNTTLENLTIENNGLGPGGLVSAQAGGLYIYRTGLAYETNVTINGGSITGNHVAESDLRPGRTLPTGIGGGVYIGKGANVIINDTSISGNVAERGGGIYSMGGGYGNVVELNNVTVDNNMATVRGGGIASANFLYPSYLNELTIRNSTISRNVVTVDAVEPHLGHGGGIMFENTTLVLDQSTVSGNSAVKNGGGLFGGTDVYDITITRSTITGNTANSNGDATGKGGGIHVSTSTMPASIDNTIVAGNSDLSAASASPDLTDNGLAITVTSSFIGTNAGSALSPSPGPNTPDVNGNLVGGGANGVLNPGLGALGDNGGPTETHLPNMGSPVLDRGSGTRVTDQRGMPGVFGAAVDMGSVERGMEGVVLDFNGDGNYDCADMGLLEAAIDAGMPVATFDVNGDNMLTSADVFAWLMDAGELRFGPGRFFKPGDANLDGVVDGSDFGIWNATKFTPARNWCQGDFNQDNVVDGSDFGIWNSNKFTSSDAGRSIASLVPAIKQGEEERDSESQRQRRTDALFAIY